MKRRKFIANAVIVTGGLCGMSQFAWAETFLTIPQAKDILWGPGAKLTKVEVELTKAQMKSIAKAAKVRVRNAVMNVWKTPENGWFIVDQVIGKHENIDMAVALDPEGKVKGIEILTYRESYGHEVRNGKWRAQFHGKGVSDHLRLDQEIKNISGATLSCSHITDGINRLTQTWKQVLRHL